MHPPRVAVINTSKELNDILQAVLTSEGCIVFTEFTHTFKGREKEFAKYIKIFKPDVIVYDIAIPYDENYKLFKKLSELAKNIPFVLTTTNKDAVMRLIGNLPIYEVIGKPADMEEIIDAVKKAAQKST